MSHMPLARRYRPQKFADVLGQESAVIALKNALTHQKTSHAYLFCGTRGAGKTTLARLLAKAVNCEQLNSNGEPCDTCSNCRFMQSGSHLDVIEIDGASHRGIDDIRQIKETVSFQPSMGRYKVYIIDEVHMLTKEAFNALLKTLEEPPINVKFIFATTEPHKVPATILSRCQRFSLKRIPPATIEELLQKVLKAEGIEFDPQALSEIAERAEGSFRDSLSLLDQILAFEPQKVTYEAVGQLLGITNLELLKLYEIAVQSGSSLKGLELAHAILETGIEASYFIEELQRHYRNLLQFICAASSMQMPPEKQAFYHDLTKSYQEKDLLFILDFLQQSYTYSRQTLQPRLHLEITLLHLIQKPWQFSLDRLLTRLENLERRLGQTSNTHSNDLSPNQIEGALKHPQQPAIPSLLHAPDHLITAQSQAKELKSNASAYSQVQAPSTATTKSSQTPQPPSKPSTSTSAIPTTSYSPEPSSNPQVISTKQAAITTNPSKQLPVPTPPTPTQASSEKQTTLAQDSMAPGRFESLIHFAAKELGGHLLK